MAEFLDRLVSHYVLDDGKLVVAHAGLKEEMQGRGSGKVRDFALYGETTGETDEFGLPVRHNWAKEYRGPAMVVYGHTPVPAPEWLNRTVNIDTGCVFGGLLTALRYPENEFVSVPAGPNLLRTGPAVPPLDRRMPVPCRRTGSRSSARRGRRTGQADHPNPAPWQCDDSRGECGGGARGDEPVCRRPEVAHLPAADYVTLRDQRRARIAGAPGRGVRLLPRPGRAARGLPGEAHGIAPVVIVCRDEDAARARFGVGTGELGIVTTRTGRRFFSETDLERSVLDRVRSALDAGDFWSKLDTTWACFDCELMPWSAKAQDLLRTQYAAVGSAGSAALPHVLAALEEAASRLDGLERAKLVSIEGDYRQRAENVVRFVAAYRHYCWPVNSLADLKLALFICWPRRGTSIQTRIISGIWRL